MIRLIDADAAYKAACEGADNWDGGCSPYRDDCIREEMDKVPTASPWHRVEEEFPKIGKIVLVYDDLDRLSICQLDNRYRWFRQGGGWIDVPYARYWMPIPEPPKEDA